jgi:hypothetical protein
MTIEFLAETHGFAGFRVDFPGNLYCFAGRHA